MEKRGQFYLLAAIVIIAVIIGFVFVSNQVKTKEEVKVYDLGQELGIENGNVLQYGTYNGLDTKATQTLYTNFTQTYANYAGESKNLYFVFGNKENIFVATYAEVETGSISVNLGSTTPTVPVNQQQYNVTSYGQVTGDEITVNIGNFSYDFTLQSGQNFYFVISQQIGGENYVATNT